MGGPLNTFRSYVKSVISFSVFVHAILTTIKLMLPRRVTMHRIPTFLHYYSCTSMLALLYPKSEMQYLPQHRRPLRPEVPES